MISVGKQAIVVVAVVVVVVFINTTASSVVNCEEPPYLQVLKNEVRPFYTLTSGPNTNLHQQGPCSYSEGNQIGKPRWPVYTLEPWHAEMSTCPWSYHIDEDVSGYRYPCRITTARLMWGELEDTTGPDHRLRCWREPGTRHNRSDGKICKHLLQDVPVVTRTGCRNGVNDYAIQNITITVGYTCTFDD